MDTDLPEDYAYKLLENSNDKFVFLIRNINDKDTALAWLSAYEKQSKTTWRKKRTYPNAGKINIFREDYRCHHNTDGRYRSKEGQKISKNTGCEATLKLIVRRFPEKNSYDGVDLKEYPCMVMIENNHNHCIDSAAVLRFRPMSDETKKKLLAYFCQGFSASRARHALETELLLENEENEENKENYETQRADGAFFPSVSVIQHLFDTEFLKSYGAKYGAAMEADLQVYLDNKCEITGSKAYFEKNDNNLVIALCTPIMRRALEMLPQATELIHVDASGNMDRYDHRIYFFLTTCVAGGVPIGCIITNNEKEVTFNKGVELLISCLPPESNFVKNGPSVFMTDGDLKERKVLSKIWKDSVLLLCQFHVLKAVWSWVIQKCEKSKRREIYFLFKGMLTAKSTEELNVKWDEMQKNPLIQSENVLKYFSGLWEKKKLWATCYRQGLPIRGNNTNNYIEALFRILKDCILDRVKALSVIQLTDFIMTTYESYLKNRLLDFSFNRFSKYLLQKFMPECSFVNSDEIIYDTINDVYIVQGKNEKYEVDLSGYFCTCPKGNTGQICKHTFSVLKKYSVEAPLYINSYESRILIFKIALGKEPKSKSFLQDLSFNPCNSKENQRNSTESENKVMAESTMNDINKSKPKSTNIVSKPNINFIANPQEDESRDVTESDKETAKLRLKPFL